MPSAHRIFFVYAFLAALALVPVLCVVVSAAVAKKYGCRLDEGGVHPCLIGGRNIGPLLYKGFMMGWVAVLTVPGAGLGALVFTGYLIYCWVRR